MNYQDYQKNKERKFPIGAKVTPGDPIKIERSILQKEKYWIFYLNRNILI